MLGVSTGGSQVARQAVFVVLVVSLSCSLNACGSVDSASPSSTAPLSITVSPTVIAPPIDPTTLSPASTAASAAEPEKISAQLGTSGPSEVSSTEAPLGSDTSVEETGATVSATISLAIPDDELPASEAGDRRAIEGQWLAFWGVNLRLADIPEDELESVVATVAVDPVKTGLVEAARKAQLAGRSNFGDISHRLFWNVPIGSSGEAIIGDCQDQSRAGSVDRVTGEKSPTGGSQLNYRGFFRKGSDGVWRVSRVQEQVGVGCPTL